MKRTIKYIAIFSMAILLSSCGNEWLDLKADNAFSSNETLTTKDHGNMLSGMYNAVQGNSDNVVYYGGRFIYSADVKADDFQDNPDGGSSRAGEDFLYTFEFDNEPGIWTRGYYIIKTANAVIAAMPSDEAANATVVKHYRGQGHFVRALVHFDLLRQYGEFYDRSSKYGVAVIDRTIKGEEFASIKFKRSTVEATYTAIVADLTAAISLMVEDKKAGYANKWAAKALLARVYLYMGENQKCLDLSNEVIAGPYALFSNAEYSTVWSKQGNTEAIFEVINMNADNCGREGIGYLMAPPGGFGYGDIIPTKQYMSLFSADDIRKSLFVEVKSKTEDPVNGKNNYTKSFLSKYPGTVASTTSPTGFDAMTTSIWVLRLSEVYLNAAEAAVKLNNPAADALLKSIVDVRYAAGKAPVITGANLDRVMLERRLELGGEGFRFYDAIRNNRTMYRDNVKYKDEIVASGVVYDWVALDKAVTDNEELHTSLSGFAEIKRGGEKTIFPIPVSEIQFNPDLEQHPSWL